MARADSMRQERYGRERASSSVIDERRGRPVRPAGPPRGRGPGKGGPGKGRNSRVRKPRPPKWTRITIITGAIVALISFGGVAAAYGISGYLFNKIDRQDILPSEIAAPVEENRPMNFLVLGSDSREGRQTQDLDETGQHSDVIMLVHVKADLSGAFIVSIPRDSYVNVPPQGTWGGGMDKLTHAMFFGGARITARAVYNLTQLPLTGVILVNFAGIHRMVEAVGGVEVCTPIAYESSFSHKWFDVGCHELSAQDAEFWARERYNLPASDLSRIKNQQQLIKGLMKKVVSGGIITDPGRLNNLINAAASSLTVDEGLDLRELAFKLKDINPDNVKFATAPHLGTSDEETSVGIQNVLLLNMPATNELFAAIREERIDQWIAAHPESQSEIAEL